MKYSFNAFVDGLEIMLRDISVKGKRYGEPIKCITVFVPARNNCKNRVRLVRCKKRCNEIMVTWGKPNYEEREFLKLCKKTKCHPKRFWLRFFPGKKKVVKKKLK